MRKHAFEGTMLTEIGIEEPEGVPLLDPNLKHELLKQLEPEILERIKRGFDLYKGSVTMSQFIVIMVDVLFQQTNWKKYPRQILTFVELFLLIDLNNLQKIRFDEFTNYLIDREEGEVAKEQCQFLPAQRLNEMQLQTDRVFKLERSNFIGLLTNNKKNVEILEKKNYKRVDHLTCGGPLINCIIFIDKYGVYCLSSNDKHISFYENIDHTLIRRFSVPDNLFFLTEASEDSSNHRLIAASTNGHIYEFSLARILSVLDKKNKEAIKQEERKIRQYPPDKQYRYFTVNKIIEQQSDISCIDVMTALDLLVTGANDSKVRLYQIRQNGLVFSKELDGHYKGIKGVSISIHHKLIVSCSFDFDILVWNAYLEHPVARLEGHQAPLMNVECPRNYQIIISMDSKSIMKIWSSENYQLIQNIVIYENFPANTSINFIFKNQTNLVMVWTKRVKFYQYVVNYNPKLTDDVDLTAVKYSKKNLEIYVGSRRSIKVWSITKGTLTKTFKDIVRNDISIIELDDRERKCFIGTIQGQIISIDLFSGLLINSYSPHDQEISLLVYNNQHQLLISGGWDRRIKIHNDTHHLERIEGRDNVMRNINNVSEKDISGGYFSPAQLVIATFSKSNVCKIWDFEKGFLQTQFIVASDINNVILVDPLPLLIIVDSKGTIYLFSTKYYLRKPYAMLTQWKNMYSIQKSSQITFISHNYQESKNNNPVKCELILGDQFGYIRIIDLSEFIAEQQLKPVTAEMIGNKNPYRIEDYNYQGMTENASNTHDFSKDETKNIVPPSNIRQNLQIKAHSERVTYVAIVQESTEKLILTAGSDNLVKIWNQQGEPRGIMRQGLKENKAWQYETNRQWCSMEITQYNKVKSQITASFQDYLFRKRKEVVPFTEDIAFEEINNDTIYQDLKEVQRYLERSGKKSSNRLY